MTAESILEAAGIVVNRGGRRVLDVPSLRIRPGEVLAVIGPNGSGKTTLVQCLALLLRPDSGVVSYNGRPIDTGRAALQQRRRLAVVFQDPLLLRGTVRDNVSLGLRLRGFPHKEIVSRVEKWLECFGIAGLAGRQVGTLSGGESRRVSLARAFALEPEVMFLDEPFAALDTPSRQALAGELVRALRMAATTTVMVTHDRDEALALGDRIAVMLEGKVQQLDLPHTVFSRPANESVAEFVGAENILPGQVTTQSGGMATVALTGGSTIDAVSDLSVGTPVTACLRPEDITLAPVETAAATSARNRLKCTVREVLPGGARTRVRLDCGTELIALITSRSCTELGLVAGKEVTALFKASSVHLIPRK